MSKEKIIFVCILLSVNVCAGDVITVNWDGSGDYTSIQAAIDDANEMDTIVVAEGTYEENVNFNGKSITVRSVEPRDWDVVNSTIIDGNHAGSCVVFENGETNDAVLEGFTLTHGAGTYVESYEFAGGGMSGFVGGGIYCRDSSPVISNCNIVRNGAWAEDPLEPQTDYGGGIGLIGNCQADVTGCIIAENISERYGGGIVIRSAAPQQATSTIRNCTIANNDSQYSYGSAGQYEVDCWDTQSIISNTIIYGLIDRSLFIADASLVTYCDVKETYIWDGWFPDYEDEPYDLTAAGGNISENPKFLSMYSNAEEEVFGEYHLTFDSPCIDAGDPNYSAGESETDIDGEDRVMGAIVDMGADEFVSTIAVTKPAGGEIWAAGSTHIIEWRSAAIAGTVDAAYSTDGGEEWTAIEEGGENDGTCGWVLPVTDSNDCIVKVILTDEPGYTEYEYSGVFSIHSSEAGPSVDSVWPTLGGNFDRTGLSQYSGPELGCVKWQYSTAAPVYISTTVGANGQVHIACEDGLLYTVESDTGSLLWSYDTGSALLSAPSVGPDGTVYAGTDNGKLYAIDKDGQLRWTHRGNGFIYSSPAVDDAGRVFFGSQEGKVYAVGPDGSDLWEYSVPGPGSISNAVLTSPAIGIDGNVYVGAVYSPTLYALDPATGGIVWECDFEHLADPQDPESEIVRGGVFSAPVVGRELVIYVSLIYDTNLYAVDPADGSILWSTELADTDSGVFDEYYSEPGDTETLFYNVGDSCWSEPVIGPDGTIYVNLDDPYLRAIDPADGSIKWVSRIGMIGGFTMSVGNDGLIYAASDDGGLHVINADGEEVGRFESGNWLSYPVIATDGTVLLSDADNTVWAISTDSCDSTTAEMHRPADLTQDRTVNMSDFVMLANEWLECSAPAKYFGDCYYYSGDEIYITGDVNIDMYIDIEDLIVMAQDWLNSD